MIEFQKEIKVEDNIRKKLWGVWKDDENFSSEGIIILQKDIWNRSELRHTLVRLQPLG